MVQVQCTACPPPNHFQYISGEAGNVQYDSKGLYRAFDFPEAGQFSIPSESPEVIATVRPDKPPTPTGAPEAEATPVKTISNSRGVSQTETVKLLDLFSSPPPVEQTEDMSRPSSRELGTPVNQITTNKHQRPEFPIGEKSHSRFSFMGESSCSTKKPKFDRMDELHSFQTVITPLRSGNTNSASDFSLYLKTPIPANSAAKRDTGPTPPSDL